MYTQFEPNLIDALLGDGFEIVGSSLIGINDEDDHDNDQNIADTFGEESQGDEPEEDMEFNKVDNNDDEHDDDDDEHDDDDDEKTLDYEVKEDADIVGEEEDGCDAEEIVVESDNDNSIGTTSTEGISCSKNNNLTGCNVFFLITVINVEHQWNGFKIIGDNLDQMVRPRYMSQNRQSCSLNYFNSYAVKDRIDLSSHPNFKPFLETDVDYDEILPSTAVHDSLMCNLVILVSRILIDILAAFKFYFEDAVIRLINHPHSADMSKKSEVVCFIAIIMHYNLH